MSSYDIIGNIAIIKSEADGKAKTKLQKLKEAKELLKRPSIKTVLEKASEVKGRLRTFKTKFIAGEKNLIAMHKENDSLFKLNVETCYFSPRQGNDRKQLALRIKKLVKKFSDSRILVMFSGICCYPIVVYKIAKPKSMTAIEISRECNIYAKENLRLNKLEGKIKLIQGDVKKKVLGEKFDLIVMVRPNLETTFLDSALRVSKKGTIIFYQGFCKENELEELKNRLIKEAEDLKRKIKIVDAVKAGEIAPYKLRYRIEIKVMK